jgi:hypothetical protein
VIFVSVIFVSVIFVSVIFVSVIFVSVIFVSVIFVSVSFDPERQYGARQFPYAEANPTAGCFQARASVTPHVKPIPADASSNNCPGRISPSRRICT